MAFFQYVLHKVIAFIRTRMEENFTLVKLFPRKNLNIINNYKQWKESNPESDPYKYYKENILNTSDNNPNYDSTDTLSSIVIPEFIERPKPQFPENASIINGFLAVLVTITIDTAGFVEYAHLFDIYRNEKDIVHVEPFLELEDKTPWRKSKITKYDLPFIKLSLLTSIESRFTPALQKGKPLKVRMNMPFNYKIR